jgi:CRP-like cAMP-binding protein
MSGKIMRALRSCAQTRWLEERELHRLASCGRLYAYASGEMILHPEDVCLCILQRGRVRLSIRMAQEGEQCGGEATLELATPGVAFGWGKWVDPTHLAVSARATTPVIVARFEMAAQLCESGFATLGLQMILHLYGLLQEGGICPPNVGTFLELEQINLIMRGEQGT